jgi:radical SAM superfamily enzyme YgiQ (UPF0313 family)
MEKKSSLRHAMISLSGEVLNRVDPLGARCIMGAIEAEGHTVDLLLEDRLFSRSEILKRLKLYKPDVLWISIQPLAFGALDFILEASCLSQCPLILGNVGSRAISNKKLEKIGKTVIIVDGQGESATRAICRLLEKDPFLSCQESLKAIDNLRFFDSEKKTIEITPNRPSRRNSDFRISTYLLEDAIRRDDIINARSSAGCDAACTFCTVRAINNGQGWNAGQLSELEYWLRSVVKAGKRDGSISMTDDDLAGSLANLENVSELIHKINTECQVNLRFNFSTRADHLYHPNDSEEQREKRRNIWKRSAEIGLDAIFLGLESGSKTQLRRLGKGCAPETNFEAVKLARELGIRVEVGFIPLDPLMSQATWRQEMLDNIKLARYAEVFKTSPTWLAPARIYKESALETFARKKGLLGEHNSDTDEFDSKFVASEVVDFMNNLGPVLCQEFDGGITNPYYRFKREFKALQRRPAPLFRFCSFIGETLIELELQFAEGLIHSVNESDTLNCQLIFLRKAKKELKKMELALKPHLKETYVEVILDTVVAARRTLEDWSPGRNSNYAIKSRNS